MSENILVKCPRCKKEFLWDLDNPQKTPHRPFCSSACKNVDFLSWANDEYKISRELTQDEEEILVTNTMNNNDKPNSVN